MMLNFLNKSSQDQPPHENANEGELSQALGVNKGGSDRSQDEFLSIASHELRTPLTAIKGNASLIQQYYWNDLHNDELKQMIKDIDHASERMLKLINYFLDTLRLEQNLVKYDLQEFDVVQLVAATVHEHQQYVRHDVHLMFKGPQGNLPQVYADKKWIKHVLDNLLDNALKFTERGNVTVSTAYDSQFVKVMVADTGQGIAHEARDVIFKKFAQTKEDILTRETAQGPGLGLYMSKLIMDQLRGSVQLEYSEPGAGSTFSISAPIAR